jgi:hypothetical protein
MEEKDIDHKAIRTYEGDIADSIQHRQTSQASMVVAAQEKKHEEEVLVVHADEAPKTRGNWLKNTLMILGSLILLGAGVAAVYYFYTISPLSVRQPTAPAPVQTAVTVSSIVTPDLQKVADITNQNPSGIINKINQVAQANQLQSGDILEIILGQEASTTQNGKVSSALERVTGPQFFVLMGLLAPDALTTSLTDQWMLGFYSASNTTPVESAPVIIATTTVATTTATSTTVIATTSTSTDTADTEFTFTEPPATVATPFIILTNNFFQNAFAGMLSWESTMPSDLSAIFGITPAEWSSGTFHDKLVKNKNVREFTDSSGSVLFLYSFIDNNTLVIAQNEAALTEIITRFENQAYVR